MGITPLENGSKVQKNNQRLRFFGINNIIASKSKITCCTIVKALVDVLVLQRCATPISIVDTGGNELPRMRQNAAASASASIQPLVEM